MPDFQPRYCGHCGYDLTGLPRQGTCPECGHAYDVGTGRGISDGSRRRIQSADRLRTILVASLIPAVILVGGLLALFASRPKRVLALAGFLAGLCLLAAITSYLYEGDG